MRLGIARSSRGVLRFLGIGGLALALCALAMSTHLDSALASSSCPNEAFRTGPAANLPDCRAYEMVSPPSKNGGQVDGGTTLETEPSPQQASPDGEAVTYGSQTAFAEGGAASAMPTSQYISRRTASGWVTQAVTPKQSIAGGRVSTSVGTVDESLFTGFNEDLTRGYLVADEPAPVSGAPVDYYSPYLQNEQDGSFTLLSDVTPPVVSPGPGNCCEGFATAYAGMSSDGQRVIFEANDALTSDAAPGHVNLYEWNEGHLELVNVLPDGEVDAEGEENVHGGASFARLSLGFGGNPEIDEPGERSNYSHALSSNGERAFWESTGVDHQVYMHEITPTGSRTVEVSASQKTNGTGPGGTDPNGPLASHFWTASSDGSLVYFTSCAQLTDDSTAQHDGGAEVCSVHSDGTDAEQGADLYQYNVDTGVLSDLTVDRNSGEAADVKGVIGASEDGSYVYFVADGVLAPGARSAEEGAHNLYAWHNGTTTFIATLEGTAEEEKDWDPTTNHRTARVSPDGSYVVFQSSRSLTGYDNVSGAPKGCDVYPYETADDACMEVYEYGAQTGKLICVSCNPTGVRPVGISIVPKTLHALESISGWQTGTQQQRYLLDDGRVFFQSADQLVPQASNGQSNVYEWEPDEVGGCSLVAGCVYLISSGTSQGQSYFTDASTDGSNVFLITSEQLVAADGDEELDLYDARVDGGFPSGSPPPCGGEACRPPVTPAPAIYGAPPSATFVGPGNPSAQPSTGAAVKQKQAPKKRKASKHKKKPKKRRSAKRTQVKHSRKAAK
jgi:hypothetical protein